MRLLDSATTPMNDHDYPRRPVTSSEAYGDVQLNLPNGTESLGDVLERLTPETYENADQARLAMYSAVSSKGIGRVGYSDRDPVSISEDGPDQLSI